MAMARPDEYRTEITQFNPVILVIRSAQIARSMQKSEQTILTEPTWGRVAACIRCTARCRWLTPRE